MKDELLVMNKQMARGGIDWIWTCIWSKRKDEVVRGEHGSWPLGSSRRLDCGATRWEEGDVSLEGQVVPKNDTF